MSRAKRTQARVIAVLDLPYAVQDALKLFREALPRTDFKIIQVDNEGFEAEIYLKAGDSLGVIQIRMSACPEASAAFINIVV